MSNDNYYSKIVFDILGTCNYPSEHRETFPDFLMTYIRAANKKKNAIIFKNKLLEFLDKCDDDIILKMDYDQYDNFYIIEIKKPQIENYVLSDNIYDFFKDSRFEADLYELVTENGGELKITKEGVKGIVDSFFTEKENRIFDMVEYFEKNVVESVLEQDILKNKKMNKSHNIKKI